MEEVERRREGGGEGGHPRLDLHPPGCSTGLTPVRTVTSAPPAGARPSPPVVHCVRALHHHLSVHWRGVTEELQVTRTCSRPLVNGKGDGEMRERV